MVATSSGKSQGKPGDEPEPGDKVGWDSSAGHSTGKVIRKVTSPTRIKGHKAAASPDNPQFIVESEKTGARAAHKASALKPK